MQKHAQRRQRTLKDGKGRSKTKEQSKCSKYPSTFQHSRLRATSGLIFFFVSVVVFVRVYWPRLVPSGVVKQSRAIMLTGAPSRVVHGAPLRGNELQAKRLHALLPIGEMFRALDARNRAAACASSASSAPSASSIASVTTNTTRGPPCRSSHAGQTKAKARATGAMQKTTATTMTTRMTMKNVSRTSTLLLQAAKRKPRTNGTKRTTKEKEKKTRTRTRTKKKNNTNTVQ